MLGFPMKKGSHHKNQYLKTLRHYLIIFLRKIDCSGFLYPLIDYNSNVQPDKGQLFHTASVAIFILLSDNNN
jgi:hypothetical protein